MRKQLVLATFLLWAVGSNADSAEPPATEAGWRLSVLTDAANALGAAADAIGKLGDSVAHLVSLGDHTWQTVSARRTRARLVDISARASVLVATQNAAIVSSIDDYLEKPHPDVKDWQAVTSNISTTLESVTNLLRDLEAERSDFVLQSAYETLLRTTAARVTVLMRLQGLSPPIGVQERDELMKINANYKILIENFKTAISEMNKYLQSTGAN
jgi:hypothetical protein